MTKKILFILFIGIISVLSIQCSKESRQARNQKSYEVKSTFFYSDDAGRTYGNSRKEFKVGETVYMKMVIQINNKKEKSNWIFVFIIIGAIIGGVICTIPFPVVGSILGAVGGGITGAIFAVIALVIAGGALGAGSSIVKDELTTKPLEINGELIIPNITSVDARHIGGDGDEITPLKDELNGITTYPISMRDSTPEWTFEFQFIPNKESEISVRLIFDNNIAKQYDRMNTIIFVK